MNLETIGLAAACALPLGFALVSEGTPETASAPTATDIVVEGSLAAPAAAPLPQEGSPVDDELEALRNDIATLKDKLNAARKGRAESELAVARDAELRAIERAEVARVEAESQRRALEQQQAELEAQRAAKMRAEDERRAVEERLAAVETLRVQMRDREVALADELAQRAAELDARRAEVEAMLASRTNATEALQAELEARMVDAEARMAEIAELRAHGLVQRQAASDLEREAAYRALDAERIAGLAELGHGGESFPGAVASGTRNIVRLGSRLITPEDGVDGRYSILKTDGDGQLLVRGHKLHAHGEHGDGDGQQTIEVRVHADGEHAGISDVDLQALLGDLEIEVPYLELHELLEHGAHAIAEVEMELHDEHGQAPHVIKRRIAVPRDGDAEAPHGNVFFSGGNVQRGFSLHSNDDGEHQVFVIGGGDELGEQFKKKIKATKLDVPEGSQHVWTFGTDGDALNEQIKKKIEAVNIGGATNVWTVDGEGEALTKEIKKKLKAANVQVGTDLRSGIAIGHGEGQVIDLTDLGSDSGNVTVWVTRDGEDVEVEAGENVFWSTGSGGDVQTIVGRLAEGNDATDRQVKVLIDALTKGSQSPKVVKTRTALIDGQSGDLFDSIAKDGAEVFKWRTATGHDHGHESLFGGDVEVEVHTVDGHRHKGLFSAEHAEHAEHAGGFSVQGNDNVVEMLPPGQRELIVIRGEGSSGLQVHNHLHGDEHEQGGDDVQDLLRAMHAELVAIRKELAGLRNRMGDS